MTTYYPAKFMEAQFHCPICGVFASQKWSDIYFDSNVYENRGSYTVHFIAKNMMLCECTHCKNILIWKNAVMVFPDSQIVAQPHSDMPKAIKADYEEALAIFNRSPRGATALLRLAIQKLMTELGEKGKNINDDISSLVKKGLSIKVQKALDYCRVVGNNAVHPAELNFDDTPEIAEILFKMINYIIEEMITRPKEIDEFYNLLPEGARDAIDKRDGKTKE